MLRWVWTISLLLLGCADEYQGDGFDDRDDAVDERDDGGVPDAGPMPVCQTVSLSDTAEGLAQGDGVRERRYAAFCFDMKYSTECRPLGSAGDVVCDTLGRPDDSPGYAVVWQSTSEALVGPALDEEDGEQFAFGELMRIASGTYRVVAYDEPLLNVAVGTSLTFEFAEGTCTIDLRSTGAGLTLCME